MTRDTLYFRLSLIWLALLLAAGSAIVASLEHWRLPVFPGTLAARQCSRPEIACVSYWEWAKLFALAMVMSVAITATAGAALWLVLKKAARPTGAGGNHYQSWTCGALLDREEAVFAIFSLMLARPSHQLGVIVKQFTFENCEQT